VRVREGGKKDLSGRRKTATLKDRRRREIWKRQQQRRWQYRVSSSGSKRRKVLTRREELKKREGLEAGKIREGWEAEVGEKTAGINTNHFLSGKEGRDKRKKKVRERRTTSFLNSDPGAQRGGGVPKGLRITVPNQGRCGKEDGRERGNRIAWS